MSKDKQEEQTGGEVPRALQAQVRRFGLEPLEENRTHRFRMHIKSESTNALYIVAQSKSNGSWGCSCPGWIRHRVCKHLRAIAPILNAPEFRAKL